MQLGKDIAAVITGGASGLGAATARALSGKGVKVAILDVNEAAGTAFAKEIGGMFAKCDVTSEADVDAALAAARKAHGQERILVNCAGIAIGQRTAREMDHLPVSGPDGSLERLAGLRAGQKVYTHINNTNPMLIEDSPQRLLVERHGLAVGADGMRFTL